MTFETISSLALIGAGLLAGLFILRLIFRFAWKIIRVALVLLSVLLVTGYFLGFLNITLR